MPIQKNELETALAITFPDSTIVCTDLAGDNDHWQVTITSSAFTGKPRIAQHKMVQESVKTYDIHALAITTKIPV